MKWSLLLLCVAVSHFGQFACGMDPGPTAAVAKWKNESYMTTLLEGADGKWTEVFDKNGQLHLAYREVTRNKEYVELYCDERKYAIRLLATRMELQKDGKWEWAANGNWVGPAPQVVEGKSSAAMRAIPATKSPAPAASENAPPSPSGLSRLSTDPVLLEFLRFCFNLHSSMIELDTLEQRADGLGYLQVAVKDAKYIAATVADGMVRDGDLSERRAGRFSSKLESKMRELHIKRAAGRVAELESAYQKWQDALKKSNREARSGPYYSLWQAWVRATKAREDLLLMKFKALKTGVSPDAKNLDVAARKSLKLTEEFAALLARHPDWMKYSADWEHARSPREAGNSQVGSLAESGRYFSLVKESSLIEQQLSSDNPKTREEHNREIISDRQAALSITIKEARY